MPRLKLAVLFALLFLLASSSVWAGNSSLYESLSKKSQVAIFIAEPTILDNQKAINMAEFQAAIAEALKNRKSITFNVVQDAKEAYLLLDVQVHGYVFSLTDPVDMLIGAAAIAMDAAKNDHYASMEATFTIRDSNGAVLWADKLRGSITDEKMSEDESYAKVFEKISQAFIKNAFGKKSR